MRATFFMTGQNLRSHKNLARRVHEAGHEIANHSLTHARFLFTGRKKAAAELKETSSLIEDITGHATAWFRPPYGVVTPAIFSACKQLGLRIVLWNVNSHDYVLRKQSGIARRVIKKIGPGAIVLFHECHFLDPSKNYAPTAGALSEIAPFLAREGLRTDTIGSLLMESRT
jgi:peptidoglycan/xylan/chitin deacetylase (PgdA/CDA1 family)